MSVNSIENRARSLELQAAALRASEEKVTVELSLPLAWWLRDMVGLGSSLDLLLGIPLDPDLYSLNDALGTRTIDGSVSVSAWSATKVRKVST